MKVRMSVFIFAILFNDFTVDEIKATLFQMRPTKALVPNGMKPEKCCGGRRTIEGSTLAE